MLIADYTLKIVNLLIGETHIVIIRGYKNAKKIEHLKAITKHLINLETLIYITLLARIVKLMD